MAVIVPTTEEIVARFPFLDGREDQIEAILPEAQRGVDESWIEADTKTAIMYLVAHLIEAEDMGGSGSGGEVASESFGPISVSYREGGGVALTGYSSTLYGKRYLDLLRKNRGGPVVIEGRPIC